MREDHVTTPSPPYTLSDVTRHIGAPHSQPSHAYVGCEKRKLHLNPPELRCQIATPAARQKEVYSVLLYMPYRLVYKPHPRSHLGSRKFVKFY